MLWNDQGGVWKWTTGRMFEISILLIQRRERAGPPQNIRIHVRWIQWNPALSSNRANISRQSTVKWRGGALVLWQQSVEVILPLLQHLPKVLLKKHGRRFANRDEERAQAYGAADKLTETVDCFKLNHSTSCQRQWINSGATDDPFKELFRSHRLGFSVGFCSSVNTFCKTGHRVNRVLIPPVIIVNINLPLQWASPGWGPASGVLCPLVRQTSSWWESCLTATHTYKV